MPEYAARTRFAASGSGFFADAGCSANAGLTSRSPRDARASMAGWVDATVKSPRRTAVAMPAVGRVRFKSTRVPGGGGREGHSNANANPAPRKTTACMITRTFDDLAPPRFVSGRTKSSVCGRDDNDQGWWLLLLCEARTPIATHESGSLEDVPPEVSRHHAALANRSVDIPCPQCRPITPRCARRDEHAFADALTSACRILFTIHRSVTMDSVDVDVETVAELIQRLRSKHLN